MLSWMTLLYIPQWMNTCMDDLLDLFKVLQKYGLKISLHKCQSFMKKILYMGLEFQVEDDKGCYTPLKDKCEAI